MTERLYYTDPNLTEFEGRFVAFSNITEERPHLGIILDRTAFYPTSGGQLFDTGWLSDADFPDGPKLRIVEVTELPSGDIAHCVEVPEGGVGIQKDAVIRGVIDRPRRRDHMQQHTGQHLLSAVFIELFNAPTVSFHMGDETCTIDLDVKALSPEQIREVKRRSNQIIADDVLVEIKFAPLEEARQMGVRKIPPEVKDKLRLIEIRGHDLTACGGTHVGRTGEIGAILVRKTEKVKQGMRVEFVCGARAIATARQDFETLTSAAALFSSHLYDVPEQIRKILDESKSAGKREQKTLAELAEFMAARMVADTPEINGVRLITRTFADRDLGFIKLLAQKLALHPGVVALLATTVPQPSLVFAQSASGRFDMGALMKESMAALGGRGGGARDLAQGGPPAGSDVAGMLNSIATKITNAL
ncbi:MAG: alanyl-tRNA editing protein [Acidobacteriia bacterium]|nr:alanyl-tRNA editing protein [Terriglobia bacterium]